VTQIKIGNGISINIDESLYSITEYDEETEVVVLSSRDRSRMIEIGWEFYTPDELVERKRQLTEWERQRTEWEQQQKKWEQQQKKWELDPDTLRESEQTSLQYKMGLQEVFSFGEFLSFVPKSIYMPEFPSLINHEVSGFDSDRTEKILFYSPDSLDEFNSIIYILLARGYKRMPEIASSMIFRLETSRVGENNTLITLETQ